MAKQSKKSKQQWYQRSGAQSILAVVTIAVFSVIGAAFLQASHAAGARCWQAYVAPTGVTACSTSIPVQGGGKVQPDKCYILIINLANKFVYDPADCSRGPFSVSKAGVGGTIVQTADHTAMTPYTDANTADTMPYKISETIADPSNQVAKNQVIYRIPASTPAKPASPVAGGGAGSSRNGVKATFKFLAPEAASYHVCSLVRRGAAENELMVILIENAGVPTSTYEQLIGTNTYSWVCSRDVKFSKDTLSGHEVKARVDNLPSKYGMRVAKIVLVKAN